MGFLVKFFSRLYYNPVSISGKLVSNGWLKRSGLPT